MSHKRAKQDVPFRERGIDREDGRRFGRREFSHRGWREFSHGGKREFDPGNGRAFGHGDMREFGHGGGREFDANGREISHGDEREFGHGGGREFDANGREISHGDEREFSNGSGRGFDHGGGRTFSRGGLRGFRGGRGFGRRGRRGVAIGNWNKRRVQEQDFPGYPGWTPYLLEWIFAQMELRNFGNYYMDWNKVKCPFRSADEMQNMWQKLQKEVEPCTLKDAVDGLKCLYSKRIPNSVKQKFESELTLTWPGSRRNAVKVCEEKHGNRFASLPSMVKLECKVMYQDALDDYHEEMFDYIKEHQEDFSEDFLSVEFLQNCLM